jgi:hypothetical protein
MMRQSGSANFFVQKIDDKDGPSIGSPLLFVRDATHVKSISLAV